MLTRRQAQVHDIMKVAGRKWATLPDKLKYGWRSRAAKLNKRPQNDGKFTEFPTAIATTYNTTSLLHSLLIGLYLYQ